MAERVLRAVQHIQNTLTSPKERGWYYLDDSQQVQGPFPHHTMKEWEQSGLLHGDLRVRSGEDGLFVALSDLGVDPFGSTATEDLRAAAEELERVLREAE